MTLKSDKDHVMSTVVINLLGPGGVGKSTSAHGLTYFLKKNYVRAELAQEYVKRKAWENHAIKEHEQLSILGKQSKYESILYNKVDFIVAECPLILSPFYEQLYYGTNILTEAVKAYMKNVEKVNVEHKNFLLGPIDHFDPTGRFQKDKAESDAQGVRLKKWLEREGFQFQYIAEKNPSDRLIAVLAVALPKEVASLVIADIKNTDPE